MREDPDLLGLGRLAKYPRVAAAAERLPPAFDRLVRPRRFQQRRLVTQTLDDAGLLGRFERGEPLPAGYGVGLDERVVEYPWLLAQRPSGRTLDAGSVLNHAHILPRFLPRLASLDVVTLAPEREAFPDQGVSYVYADLRELPYRDNVFDTVVCVSTLEHVGMDNTAYGSDAPRAADPGVERSRAARELRRVTAPGGRLLVTVPVGDPDDLGWIMPFSDRDLAALVAAVEPASETRTVFRYTREGWQVSDAASVAGARYRTPSLEPQPDDLAARARAVACVALTV
ncbi:MAG: methyltransferase domain-containing protein [Actinobacteria bacterium]|nr:methyltransferase domain-containing protein [Actinomycetota bacterium]